MNETQIKMDHLRIHFEEIPGIDANKGRLVKLSGHFDEGNEKELEVIYKMIDEGEHPIKLVFDLEDLLYINSAGIGRIADWYSKVSGESGAMFLSNLKPDIKEVFDLVGISNLIPFFDSNKEAIVNLET